MKTATLRRRLIAVAALVAAALALLVAPAPATAEPNEGGTKELRDALEAASRGYIEAKNKLKNSKDRQLELGLALQRAEAQAGELAVEVRAVAAAAYRNGRFNAMRMLLHSASPDAFLERAMRLDMMAKVDGRALRRYNDTINQAKIAKIAIADAIKEQQQHVNAMAKRKKQALMALASQGGGAVRRGFIDPKSPLAKPARRNSDGSWPKEGCTINDPTTAGCITPRTLHAFQQAKANGFNHHAYCHRSGGGGEHPKGRACDFSAAKRGFANRNATGSDKRYGDRLAAFYVKNASRLGVMYVIWYRQWWTPGTGWRSYSGRGSPAATHTNHVHLSML